MRDAYDVYINGVGSNVVCSTISGNAKASVRGTDNKQFPRLFLCAFNSAKGENSSYIVL